MRLIIRRSQADVKGVLGGHKGVRFTLETRVEFTAEERALLDHYQMWSYSVVTRGATPITLSLLSHGDPQTVDDVTTLLRNEAVLKDALDSVPPLLEVLRSFGGEEIVEYPRGDSQEFSDWSSPEVRGVSDE